MVIKLMVSAPGTREEIIQAAERLFEHFGYGKTTVDEIAREAGIGKGTIYLQFQSKEDIAFAWIDHIHERLFNGLHAIAASQATAQERLRLMLVHRVMARYDRFARCARSMDDAFLSLKNKLVPKRDAFHLREADLFSEFLSDAQREGLLSCDDPSRTAQAMVTATNSLMPYSLRTDQLGDREMVEQRADDLARLLTRAVRGEKS